MRAFPILSLLLAALVCGCSIVYKLPTRQGNVLEQKQIDQIKAGMSRDQVKFLLGTPIAASPFRDDRWDYVGYYKDPRGKEYNRVVSVFFDKEAVARIEGQQMAAAEPGIENPDVDTVIEQEKKDAKEKSREEGPKDSGVIIQQPTSSTP